MKKYLFIAFCFILSSCTGSLATWNPYGNSPQDMGQNNQNQSRSSQDVTDPEESNVTIDDESTSDDNIDNTTFDGTVTIVYSQSGATVSGSIEGVSIQTNGARVTATNSGEMKVKYILSGNSSDGCFKLYSSRKQAIVLSGLTLTNTKGAAINNQSKKRTFIQVEGTNTLADGSVNSSGDYPEQTGEEDMKAAIFSEGQLIFSGSGSLKVTATGKSGITSDDYVRFMTGSNVSVTTAKGHGVRGKDAIVVSGGTVSVTIESTATGRKCFSSDSLVYIGGGKTTLINKAPAGTVDSEITGSAGIKADQTFVIRGGELNVTASGTGGKCINGDGPGYFEGGTVVVKSTGANYGSSSERDRNRNNNSNSVKAKGIKFDGNIMLAGSEITASSSSHEAIESKSALFITGGSISATAGDDAINSALTMTISDGVVYAYSTGNDGLDANGNLIIKGGNVFAIGCGSPEVGIDANTESGYKFYLQGGNVIAIGGVENGSSVSEAVVSTSWTRNAVYSLCSGDSVIYTFKAPASGGNGLYMFSPSLESGKQYTLKTGATISGAQTYCGGIISIGGTSSGGNSSNVSASSYSSGNNNPGGPGGPRW